MKSHILCTCIVGIFFVSTVTLGEILDDGDWDGHDAIGDWTWTTTTAHASGSNEDDTSVGFGWYYVYTTVNDYLNWSTYVYVWADVKMQLYNNESCEGLAYAYASATNPFGTDSESASVHFSDSGENGEWSEEFEGEYFISNSWYKEFSAYEGLSCEHESAAAGSVPNGADSWVHSHADTVAQGNLWEN